MAFPTRNPGGPNSVGFMQSILAIPPGFGVNLLIPKIGKTARLNEPYWLICLVLISELEIELFIDLIHMLCYLVWGII